VEGDIQIYFNYAGNILRGLIPYRDFALEYPPGALPFFLLPRLFSGDVMRFRGFFMVEVMLVDLLGLLLVLFYCRKRGFSQAYQGLAGLFYTALPAVLGLISYQRFDLIPAVIVLAAVVLFDSGCRIPAWFMLGFGFAVKLYPVILTPVFLFKSYRDKTLKTDLLFGIPAAVLSTALLWVPLMIVSGNKFWFFLKYHGERGIQLESIYSTILLIARLFGYPISTEFSYGSWNVVSTASPFLAKVSFLVMLVILGAVLVHSIEIIKRKNWEIEDLPRLSVLMIMGFIIGGKVLSPQYLLWVIPLIVIALPEKSRHRKKIWGSFIFLTLLSFVIYPVFYKSLIDLHLLPLVFLVIRNSLLVLVFYMLVVSGRKPIGKMLKKEGLAHEKGDL